MRKRLLFVFALVSLWFVMTLPASSAGYTISPYAETIRSYKEVYDALYTAIDGHITYLDVTKYNIKTHEIMHVFADIMNNSPEFFYANDKLIYRYDKKNYVTSVTLTYNMSRTKRKEATELYQKEISYIVSLVEQRYMTQMEKALYVHDYLVSEYQYDESETIRDVYHFLLSRKGVCQAYSLCYIAVLRSLHIDCYMTVSQEMQHSWNLVCIDDAWYHVDLTYDDPMPDRPGRVLHEYFLRSDASFMEEEHYGWVSAVQCQNDLYDGYIWKDTETRMLPLNDEWVYISSEDYTMYRAGLQGERKKALHTFTERWYVEIPAYSDGNNYRKIAEKYVWKGLFTGLASYNGYLFFNTPTAIWRYTPGTGDILNVLSLEDTDMNIYGMDIYKNSMEYLLANHPDRQRTAYVESVLVRYTTDDFEQVENVFLPFADVLRVSPYYDAVRFCYENNIFFGVTETEFAPLSQMTRGQFAAVLCRYLHANLSTDAAENSNVYTDVSADDWFAPYVQWVTEHGYMRGTGGGLFAPAEPVTREQAYSVLLTITQKNGVGKNEDLPTPTFWDYSMVSAWAKKPIQYGFANALIPGRYMYMFLPQTSVNRWEIAQLLYAVETISEKTTE